MFNPSDILIHGHPIIYSLLVQRTFVIVRGCKPVEIPGRFDERVHRIRLSSTGITTLWASGLHELLQTSQRRLTRPRDLHIERKDDREIVFGNGNRSTPVAI